MAKHRLNLAENSLKPIIFQSYPQKPNGISLFAFLLSILIYISIFYIFNLSPSSLLNTTKFWFFISNTLILIISIDFGAFSSSRKQANLYNVYAKNNFPSFESQYREISIQFPPQKVGNSQESQEKENKLQIVVKDGSSESNDKFQETEFPPKAENGAHEEKERETKIGNKVTEEENEFLSMSDAELNRRVEEFIRRFNKQIRIQAAQN